MRRFHFVALVICCIVFLANPLDSFGQMPSSMQAQMNRMNTQMRQHTTNAAAIHNRTRQQQQTRQQQFNSQRNQINNQRQSFFIQKSNASMQAQANKANQFLNRKSFGKISRTPSSTTVTRPQRQITGTDRALFMLGMLPGVAETVGAASTGSTYHRYLGESAQHIRRSSTLFRNRAATSKFNIRRR